MTNTILDTLERCAALHKYRRQQQPSQLLAVNCVISYRQLTACIIAWPFCMQVGMRHFNIRKNKYHCPIVNLDKLWSLVGSEVCSAPRLA